MWRMSTAHGSKGVLGDIGIHILDFATFVAGLDVAEVSGQLHTFDKAPGGKIGEYVLDANDSATMQVRLSNGALGTIGATRFASGHINDLRLRLYGLKGGVEVLFENNVSRLNVCLGPNVKSFTWEPVEALPRPTVYERFIAAIRGEGAANPDFARAAKLQRVLDAVADSDAQGGRAIRL
jgi:predicted dehydrogenase